MPLPADYSHTELYRNTVNNSATATLIDRKAGTVFHDENVTYGVTYFYWAKVVDRTGEQERVFAVVRAFDHDRAAGDG